MPSATTAMIIIDQPEAMNLLGLLLARMFERRLAEPRAGRHAARLVGDVVVRAGAMQVTLRFSPAGVLVTRAPARQPIAVLEGTLHALADAVTSGRVARHVRRGDLHFRGSILPLWHLAAILVGAAAAGRRDGRAA
jgi:hypothetical protein